MVLVPTRRGRPRWFLTVHRGAIRSRHIVRFLDALKRHRRKRVILVWDGLPAHRSRLVREAIHRHRRWLTIVWLPAYAPELNPVEPFWNHLDTTVLANTPIEQMTRLRARVHQGRRAVEQRPSVTAGFLKYTGLF